MEISKEGVVYLVEMGARTIIGTLIESPSYKHAEGYIALKNIRVIQGHMVPSSMKSIDGKPLTNQMNFQFLLLPYIVDTLIIMEDNILGFLPLLYDCPVLDMYKAEIKIPL